MSVSFSKRAGKVAIVDPISTRRFLIYEALRGAGFSSVETFSEIKTLVSFMEAEEPTWILTHSMKDGPHNALQLLKLISEHPHLAKVRVSLFVNDDEMHLLPLAFELGLFSFHKVTSVKDQVILEIETLLKEFERKGWQATLLACDYLRKFLKQGRHHAQLLNLQKQICQLYPANGFELVRLGEALALNSESSRAEATLNQALLVDPEIESDVQFVREHFLNLDKDLDPCEDAAALNVLGISHCVIVDSDTTVHYMLTSILNSLGIKNFTYFSDGLEAWEWLSHNSEPGLIIQEWKIPGLTGPLLVQRIRKHGFVQVPILVTSSLITHVETPLVQEMGVATVIEKPFEQQQLINSLVHVLQQHRNPTEQISLERRIRQFIDAGKLNEAFRLLEILLQDDRVSDASKKIMKAELMYAQGRYQETKSLVIEAFKENGESLQIYNLLGKTLLKLNEYALALKSFSKAQSFSPSNLEHLCKMAEIEQELGDMEGANLTIEKAGQLDSTAPQLLNTKAGIALINKDVNSAKSIMSQLDSVQKILALMNNRAIAMIHNNKFEEGLELYHHTFAALPDEWSGAHDAVSYNIGLAYTRYGEIDKAMTELKKVRGDAPGLKEKTKRLLQKLERAKNEKIDLVLSAADGPKHVAENAAINANIETIFEVAKGDLCCHRIFYAMELLDKKAIELMKTNLAYVQRRFS